MFVTVRTNRPASIAVALARGVTPEAPPFALPQLDAEDRAYGLTGVPETFFVDRAGRVVRKFPGAVTKPEEWFKAVEDALAR